MPQPNNHPAPMHNQVTITGSGLPKPKQGHRKDLSKFPLTKKQVKARSRTRAANKARNRQRKKI